VIISPHSIMYSDWFISHPPTEQQATFRSFALRRRSFKIEYDTEFVSALCSVAGESGFPAGTAGERDKRLDHGTMIPLHFLKEAAGGKLPFKFVRIGLSGLDLQTHYKLGKLIKQVSDMLGRNTAVIASGDLSHKLLDDGPYGYAEEGPEYDRRLMDIMSRAAFGELLEFDEAFCDRAAECGHRSFVIMAGCFDGVRVRAAKLSYEGPFGVGYGVASFLPETTVTADTEHRKSPYVELAMAAIDSYIRYGIIIDVPRKLPDELYNTRAGAFVSLHLKPSGDLRGCIGTIMPTADSLAEEIIRNARKRRRLGPAF
jgi:aromatic ring-opening dioxygenase LigB subunit